MKNLAIADVTVGIMVVTALGMPGAATAAPSGPSSVDDTVASLQAEGYKVIVTRLSGAESSNCSVDAIRPGQQITQETPTGVVATTLGRSSPIPSMSTCVAESHTTAQHEGYQGKRYQLTGRRVIPIDSRSVPFVVATRLWPQPR
jgi:hypothetical protein